MNEDANSSIRPEVQQDSTFTINCVAIRDPPFRTVTPATCFAQFKIQFALPNIMQDATQFCYVISHLDNKYEDEVEDVITNPQPQDLMSE
jgi:hypothetical protein